MKIELIVVPYDVESTDSPMARGAVRLLELGFADALTELGFELGSVETIDADTAAGKTERVISVARATARAVARASSRGRLPLIIGGGCLTAVGIAHGLQRMARDFSAVWVDAHGDFNTPETTPSGYWDGMALAALCGRSLPEVFKAVELIPVPFRRIVHLGGRAFDPPEVEDFARLNVLVVPPGELGVAARRSEIRSRLDPSRELYLHIDVDGLDPEVAPAANFPEAGGLHLEELLECLSELRKPIAITLTGFNFDEPSAEEGERQKQTCLRLLESVWLRRKVEAAPTRRR